MPADGPQSLGPNLSRFRVSWIRESSPYRAGGSPIPLKCQGVLSRERHAVPSAGVKAPFRNQLASETRPRGILSISHATRYLWKTCGNPVGIVSEIRPPERVGRGNCYTSR